MPPRPNLAKVKFGAPIALFNGRDLSGWQVKESGLKNAWIVHLAKGQNELITHVEPQDAEDCLTGKECVYLGHQIGQFIN